MTEILRRLQDHEIIREGDLAGSIFDNGNSWIGRPAGEWNNIRPIENVVRRRAQLVSPNGRILDWDEPWEKGDIIHYEAGNTCVVKGCLVNETCRGHFFPERIYDFVERPSKDKKLERCDIGDVLSIMADGDGQSPESLLKDVQDMLKTIWKRQQNKKPGLRKLIGRLNEHDIVSLYQDGSAKLIVDDFDVETAMHSVDVYDFPNLKALKKHLGILPNR